MLESSKKLVIRCREMEVENDEDSGETKNYVSQRKAMSWMGSVEFARCTIN